MRTAQEFRGGGRGAGGGEGGRGRGGREGVGRDRLKLSQGDDLGENVPLQKGAPKREFWQDLASLSQPLADLHNSLPQLFKR